MKIDKHIYIKELCIDFGSTMKIVIKTLYLIPTSRALNWLKICFPNGGDLVKNEACIPPIFLPNKNLESKSNIFGFGNNMTLDSHVPKKNKVVILLSTMHHSSKIDEETKKSYINLYYNLTKGGVGSFDQMCHAFSQMVLCTVL